MPHKAGAVCSTAECGWSLKPQLSPGIQAVGVFVNAACPNKTAELLSSGVIDIAQLHGDEDDRLYRADCDRLAHKPIITGISA